MVEASVWCPDLRIRATVQFLVDTSAAATAVRAIDMGLDPGSDFPLDDRIAFEVTDTLVASGIQVRTLLTFDDEDGVSHVEEAVLLVTDSDLKYSRLGRDILNRWLMLYDPPGSQLLFEPARA